MQSCTYTYLSVERDMYKLLSLHVEDSSRKQEKIRRRKKHPIIVKATFWTTLLHPRRSG